MVTCIQHNSIVFPLNSVEFSVRIEVTKITFRQRGQNKAAKAQHLNVIYLFVLKTLMKLVYHISVSSVAFQFYSLSDTQIHLIYTVDSA